MRHIKETLINIHPLLYMAVLWILGALVILIARRIARAAFKTPKQ